MKLVGTVSECRNDKGLYILTIRGLPIPISGISDAHAGLRTCVVGKPRWSSDKGSYFKVAKCWTTDKPDKNSVEVEGTIMYDNEECYRGAYVDTIRPSRV